MTTKTPSAFDLKRKKFHDKYDKALKIIVKTLKLKPDEYEIRHAKAWHNIIGDVVLHTKWFYVCVNDKMIKNSSSFYHRPCNGLKDYMGGEVSWMHIEALVVLNEVIPELKKYMNNVNNCRN